MSSSHPTRIRYYRLQRGLSQESLARHVGVTKAAVSKWETGLTYPRPDSAHVLAQVLQMPIGEIYTPRAA